MSWDENGDRTDLAGEFLGTVVQTTDPMKAGRIRARVDGLFGSNGSFWLYPKLPGGGDQVGLWAIPPIGSRVVVSFSAGRSTERGWYQPVGWFPTGEPPMRPPDESAGDPQIVVLASSRFVVVLDPREGASFASLRDRVSGDEVVLDGSLRTVSLSSTSKTMISSQGAVEINAPLVTVNGRPILPSGSEPI